MKLTDLFEGKETLNMGYQDGFDGEPAKNPNDKEYMSGFKIGRTDRTDRRKHLKNKQEK